jgi:hypothetical protein
MRGWAERATACLVEWTVAEGGLRGDLDRVEGMMEELKG